MQVVDFGCGALAMQFGLALAAADALEEHGTIPSITIMSKDTSEPMKEIGWNVWQSFIEKIAKCPKLNSLQEVCKAMKVDAQDDPGATRWLTALHVAYEENASQVKRELDAQIVEWEPDLVVVTTHEVSEAWAYHPLDYGYTDISHVFSDAGFVLDGEFEEMTMFRSVLFYRQIDDMLNFLGLEDYQFVRNYLTRHPTAWVTTDTFRTQDFLYRRV